MFTALPVRAAVTEAWVQRYSNAISNANDYASKVVRDVAGDIIVTGSTDDRTSGLDMLTIKYSGSDGTVVWARRYNGPGNSNDHPTALAVDGNGNVVVTGNSHNGTNHDYYAAKYAATDGALLWEQSYNGPGNGFDGTTAVVVDDNGNVVVTGYSHGSVSGADYYTAKYAATDGALLWEQRYTGFGPYGDLATALAVDGGGNVVVTGISYSSASGGDYYTAKYAAADGVLIWDKRYNGTANKDDGAEAVAMDNNGNVVVTGYSHNGTNNDLYTAKYAATDGALRWHHHYNSPANKDDRGRAITVDWSGNAVVTAWSYGSVSNGDYYTAKYAAENGSLLWERRYDGPTSGEDIPYAVALDVAGDVFVAGYSSNEANSDYYTAKYAAENGALLWEKRYNGLANSTDFASSLVVDGSGNTVVTGSSNNETNSDYYTAKYAAADGSLLWEKRYNGSVKYNDFSFAVAMDRRGNVVVTGHSSNGTNYDCYTAKYAALDGALIWERRYNGPANRDDRAWALAVDSSDNVVVTGYSQNSNWYDDYYYYTAKYAAVDGTLLWERRYNGPANGNDRASTVVMDSNGNVVVAGSSYARPHSSGLVADYYTAKYAAADGALLWEKHYNGPGDSHDVAVAVAVDGGGDVAVTGYSEGGNITRYDYYTAKYAAADGTLLWEKRFNNLGLPYSDDRAYAMALDRRGNVVVTGSSDGSCYTATYAAADGALLWEKRYDNPGTASRANAVAVDSSGNVVVTGYSESGIFHRYDYYTAKYAAADGALLWEKHYNGPDDSHDVAVAVAVDGHGDAIVTGYSYSGPNGHDYYTAKYAATDGALLWEKRYNGPANGDDFVVPSRSLALGPNGMVAITGYSATDSSRSAGFATFDYATVVYWESMPAVSIALVFGRVHLRFTGIPGATYRIQRAPAVSGLWETLATPTAPLDGLIEYIDTSHLLGSAFYRTEQQ